MRKIILATIGLAFMTMSFRCRMGGSLFDRGHGDATYIKMNNGTTHEEIKYYGKIKINDEETGIDHISPNGYLIYINDDEKLLIESNYHGELAYEVNDGGRKSSLDENGKRLLTEVVREMIAIGFDAEARADRIYKKGGSHALLTEIESLKADNVKAIYFERILKSNSLSQEDLIETTKKISSQLGSDNDKERLLNEFNSEKLKSLAVAQAYLSAVEGLGSDNGKENLLREFINKDSILHDRYVELLAAISHIGSDNGKENLLRQLIRGTIPDERFDQLLDEVSRLGSDNGKENLIREIVSLNEVTGEHFDRVVVAINHLGSENGKENLFKELIEKKNNDPAQFDKILQGINGLGSDNARVNLYRKLIDEAVKTEDQWISLISIAAQLASDNEKS